MYHKTELRAAAARLLYENNRDSADYDMLVNYIDSSEPVQHWIPCSEQMPEECERVLAIIDGVVREALYEYDAFQGSSFYRDKSTVTHWMPLPELPGREDNDG